MKELVGIQCLRALAALMVVFFHVHGAVFPEPGPETFWRALGSGGVDVFFVISGLLIWLSSGSRLGHDPARWIIHRVIRVAPLYWLTLLVFLAILAVWPDIGDRQPIFPPLAEIIASFAFVFHRSVGNGQFTPFFVPGWTLNYEMFFYLLVFLTLFIKRPIGRLAAIFAVLMALVACRKWIGSEDVPAFRYTSPLMLEFLSGVAIATCLPVLSRLRVRQGIGWAAVAASLIVVVTLSPRLFMHHGPRFVYFGLPAVLLVLGIVCLEDALRRWPLALPRAIGDSSYSLYLSHTLIWPIPAAIVALLHLPPWPSLIGCIAFLTAYAYVQYRLIERPMLQSLRRRADAWLVQRGSPRGRGPLDRPA